MTVDRLEAVKKILGEPVFIGLDEQTRKSKRNLVVLAVTILAYKYLGAEVTSFQPLGIHFPQGQRDKIDIVLLCLLGYFFLHFLWHVFDSFLEWRNRLTGIKAVFTNASYYQEYSTETLTPASERQSSLLRWWSENEKIVISRLDEQMQSIDRQIKNVSDTLDKTQRSEDINESVLRNLSAAMDKLRQQISGNRYLELQRISTSLYRFERWFRLFSWSQILRFVFFEIAVPALLFAFALGELFFNNKFSLLGCWYT